MERSGERSRGCLLVNGSETLNVGKALLLAGSSGTEPDLWSVLQRKSWHDRTIAESCDDENRAEECEERSRWNKCGGWYMGRRGPSRASACGDDCGFGFLDAAYRGQ